MTSSAGSTAAHAPLLYLDTSALKRPFDAPGLPGERLHREQVAVARIIQAIATARVRLLSSFWLVRENQVDPDVQRAAATERILQLAWASVLDTIPLRQLVAQLIAHRAPAADAPHLAAAQLGQATYCVTADYRLERRARQLRAVGVLGVAVVNPVVLVASGVV